VNDPHFLLQKATQIAPSLTKKEVRRGSNPLLNLGIQRHPPREGNQASFTSPRPSCQTLTQAKALAGWKEEVVTLALAEDGSGAERGSEGGSRGAGDAGQAKALGRRKREGDVREDAGGGRFLLCDVSQRFPRDESR
jgi:hypothetical protein